MVILGALFSLCEEGSENIGVCYSVQQARGSDGEAMSGDSWIQQVFHDAGKCVRE